MRRIKVKIFLRRRFHLGAVSFKKQGCGMAGPAFYYAPYPHIRHITAKSDI